MVGQTRDVSRRLRSCDGSALAIGQGVLTCLLALGCTASPGAPERQPAPLAVASALVASAAPLGSADAPPPRAVAAPLGSAAGTPPPRAVAAPLGSTDAPPPRAVAAPLPAIPPAEPSGPRIYAKARFVWVHPAPVADGSWIGYLTIGGSVKLRGATAEAAKVGSGRGCDAWYAIEPRGFVCLGDSTTLDPEDPVYAGLTRDAADVASPWPYHYAESMGAPRYAHLPTPAEQRAAEWDLDRHLDHVRAARTAENETAVAKIDKYLVGVDLGPADAAAPTLLEVGAAIREARTYIAPTSTIAYSQTFDAGERAWLLTSDHALIPKDRVRIYPRSEFHGIELGHGVALPLAFFRKQPRPKYRRGEDGKMAATEETWPRLAWVAITGDAVMEGAKRFFPTSETGIFVNEADASIAARNESIPFHAPASDGPRKWIDVSVDSGVLVAYEEREPVFATLISPGRGGTPYPGIDPLKTASTPTGTFRVDGKFKTATMVSSASDDIVHAEVQYVQNFHGPHALHGAYWHDGWGEPKSGGCINLAPIDSKRMFEWTDPAVPEGWHGLRAVPEMGRSTAVVVHK